jgi:hypothetical protein
MAFYHVLFFRKRAPSLVAAWWSQVVSRVSSAKQTRVIALACHLDFAHGWAAGHSQTPDQQLSTFCSFHNLELIEWGPHVESLIKAAPPHWAPGWEWLGAHHRRTETMKSRGGAGKGKENKSFLRLVALVLLVGGFAQAMGIFGALSFEDEVQHQQMGNALDDRQPSVREALAVEFEEELVLQRRQQV